MFPAKFAYAAPASLDEAIGLLEDPDAKILAGGHSLLPLMKLRLAQPRLIVDIGRIPGLAYVRREDGVIAIGAMTTYREIERSAEVHQAAPVRIIRIRIPRFCPPGSSDMVGERCMPARSLASLALAALFVCFPALASAGSSNPRSPAGRSKPGQPEGVGVRWQGGARPRG